MFGPQIASTSTSPHPPSASDEVQPAAVQAQVRPVQSPSERPISPGRRLGLVVFGLFTVVYGLLVMSLRSAALARFAAFTGIAGIVGGAVQLGLAAEVEKGLELGLGPWAVGSPGRELLLLVNPIAICLIVAGIDAIMVALTAERSGEGARVGAEPAR